MQLTIRLRGDLFYTFARETKTFNGSFHLRNPWGSVKPIQQSATD